LFLHTKRCGNIPTNTGASNAGGVQARVAILGQYMAPSRAVNCSIAKYNTRSYTGP